VWHGRGCGRDMAGVWEGDWAVLGREKRGNLGFLQVDTGLGKK
jgi:hypothetical protein